MCVERIDVHSSYLYYILENVQTPVKLYKKNLSHPSGYYLHHTCTSKHFSIAQNASNELKTSLETILGGSVFAPFNFAARLKFV